MSCYNLTPQGMKLHWRLKEYGHRWGTPGFYKGHVFGMWRVKNRHRTIFAVNIENGKVVKEVKVPDDEPATSAVLADNRLWFAVYDYVAVDPESPDFMKLLNNGGKWARNAAARTDPLKLRCPWPTPTVWNGCLFSRNHAGDAGGRKIVCVDYKRR